MTPSDTSGLTHSLSDAARDGGRKTPRSASHSDDQIKSLSKRTWNFMVGNADEKLRLHAAQGHKYTGNMPKAVSRACREVYGPLDGDGRESLTAAIREYLKGSGNAKCINVQMGHVEWWVSATWNDAMIARTFVTESDRDRSRFDRKSTEDRLTASEAGEDGRYKFPVDVRKAESDSDATPQFREATNLPVTPTPQPPTENPNPEFRVHPKWEEELVRVINMGGSTESWLEKIMRVAATWTEPFSVKDLSELYNSNTTTSAPMIATLVDAELISMLPIERVDGKMLYRKYRTTTAQRFEVERLLNLKGKRQGPSQSYDTQALILGALNTRDWIRLDDLSRSLFMTRSRLSGMLLKLLHEGKVEKTATGGGGFHVGSWRRRRVRASSPSTTSSVNPEPAAVKESEENKTLTTTDASQPVSTPAAPTSAATPSPATVPPKKVDDETRAIASMIEELVVKRVESRISGAKADLAARIGEVDELNRKKSELEKSLAEITEERDRLKTWADSFAAVLGSMPGPTNSG